MSLPITWAAGHIYGPDAVVSEEEAGNPAASLHRLKIFSEESVPLFGPPLPSPPVFTDHQEFRDFLLVKRKCCFEMFFATCSVSEYISPDSPGGCVGKCVARALIPCHVLMRSVFRFLRCVRLPRCPPVFLPSVPSPARKGLETWGAGGEPCLWSAGSGREPHRLVVLSPGVRDHSAA